MSVRPAILAGVASLASVTAHAADLEGEAAAGPFQRLWDETRASGIWRTDYFSSSKALDDDTGFLGTTLQLKALPQLTDRIDGKLELRATNSAIDAGADSDLRFLEAYARIGFSRADLYLGKQIVAWGRADGINPTDNLTPRDFTVLLPFEDDQRFGTTSLRLDTYVSQEYTFTLYATPFFESAKVPLPAAGGEWVEQRPARSLSNTQAGLRLNKVGEGLDWSVSYYRGFSLLPTVRALAQDAGFTAQVLHYDRHTVLGADFARNYGRFGFRGEVAYIDTADDAGNGSGIKNPHLYWIAGVDRTFYEYLNVNLQFFQRRVRRFQDPDSIADPLERSVALQNAIIHVQQDRVSNGITFRVSNQWLNETLEAEVFAAVNITRDNSFLRPLVTYAFSDRWKGTLGGELYFGGENTQYGGLKGNRGVFVEMRYGF